METTFATYCPEDDKLRLYVGRVPRDEYEALRAEGWTCTPKQDCNFVAVWTPGRWATALKYSPDGIEDEDQGPEERAADRAERFAGYRDNRTADASGYADRYESGPTAHGYQSPARAERAAARHDRLGDHATDHWGKAEYWQRRTAGVIGHALYKSTPAVRMGRIKTLEAELRRLREQIAKVNRDFDAMTKIRAIEDPEKQREILVAFLGARHIWAEYAHPFAEGHPNAYRRENKLSLYSLATDDARPVPGALLLDLYFSNHSRIDEAQGTQWTRHLELRLAYENQMLEAQGGRAAFVEMEVGGWIGNHQIRKVNKSPVTGRVVSVAVMVPTHGTNKWGNPDPKAPTHRLSQIDVERLPVNAYTPPTPEDKAAVVAAKAEEKAKAPKADACPLVNPTNEDAERLQKVWNERAMVERVASYKRQSYPLPVTDCAPSSVLYTTQAQYSAQSKGTYCAAGTRELFAGGIECPNYYNGAQKMRAEHGKPVCSIRRTSGHHQGGHEYQNSASRVIVLTDKPQKPLPVAVWNAAPVAEEVPA